MRMWFLMGIGIVTAGVLWWWWRQGLKENKGIVNRVVGDGFEINQSTPGYENYLKLKQGCPTRDCIPAIDEPKFESKAEADKWLKDEDVVFGLDYKGEQRAYPQRILNWHEIVNDEVDGEPVAITFCPLCGSSLAFDRKVTGRVLTFGVSGKLHNSDLVMYDRETQSLWQQITGEAIVGEFLGRKLRQIALETVRWGEWKETHPVTKVLSRDTGYRRDYDLYPYGDYEQSDELMFLVEGGAESKIRAKTVVYGMEMNGEAKAYLVEAIKRETAEDGVLVDTLGGVKIRLSYSKGEVVVENLKTKEKVVPTRLFWFAWRAFHPDTGVYE